MRTKMKITLCRFWVRFHLVILTAITVVGAAAQGTYLRNISFDGSPVIPAGWNIGVKYYYEDSMTFTPLDADGEFGRAGPGQQSWFPDNGTGYLLQAAFDTLAGARGQFPIPSRFGLYSVDLSEFSDLYAFPAPVEFIGYRSDGTIVSKVFTTDGIIDGSGPLPDFQTLFFDLRFNDLVRFEVPSHGYALDNLVFFDVVPEPSIGALLFPATALFWPKLRAVKRRQ